MPLFTHSIILWFIIFSSVIYSQSEIEKIPLAPLEVVDLTKRKAKLDMEKLRTKLGARAYPIYEPHMKENRNYLGFSLSLFLTEVFKDEWKKADDIVFVCADGYRAVVSVKRILNHKAYMTFAVEGEKNFTILDRLKKSETVPVGPYYLVWENIEDKEMYEMGASGWPYQVVGIELSIFKDNFAALLPKSGRLSKSEEAGFLAFRDHCLSCHKLNGVGGDLSKVDLNHPLNPTEYWKKEFLIKYIQEPTSIKPWVNMPSLGSRQKAKDIYSYLARMREHKSK